MQAQYILNPIIMMEVRCLRVKEPVRFDMQYGQAGSGPWLDSGFITIVRSTYGWLIKMTTMCSWSSYEKLVIYVELWVFSYMYCPLCDVQIRWFVFFLVMS